MVALSGQDSKFLIVYFPTGYTIHTETRVKQRNQDIATELFLHIERLWKHKKIKDSEFPIDFGEDYRIELKND